jgi:hypothetical protein
VEWAWKGAHRAANGWKLGYPPSRALEAACRSRGQRQGSGRCGQAGPTACAPSQIKAKSPGRSVAREAVEATTGRRVADVRVLNGQREE